MKPIFIINFKNYLDIVGAKSLELARAAESVARRSGVDIVIAPPPASLALIASRVRIPLFAQHLDDSDPGNTTGFMTPEAVRSYGVSGSLVNHSEHRLPYARIENLVERLRELRMTSVVCARTPAEVRKLAALEPDYIAIEPPELIGSGIAVSRARPGVITGSVKAARASSRRARVICGAGIVDAADVTAAIKLGSNGILVASGIVKAKNWRSKIKELADAMKAG